MFKEEKINEKIKSQIAIEMKKAQMMTFLLNRGTRWYERPAVIGVLLINSVLPLAWGLKLCFWTTCLLAKNPTHRVAVDAVKRITNQKG